jgi:hypothetical protein
MLPAPNHRIHSATRSSTRSTHSITRSTTRSSRLRVCLCLLLLHHLHHVHLPTCRAPSLLRDLRHRLVALLGILLL